VSATHAELLRVKIFSRAFCSCFSHVATMISADSVMTNDHLKTACRPCRCRFALEYWAYRREQESTKQHRLYCRNKNLFVIALLLECVPIVGPTLRSSVHIVLLPTCKILKSLYFRIPHPSWSTYRKQTTGLLCTRPSQVQNETYVRVQHFCLVVKYFRTTCELWFFLHWWILLRNKPD